MSNNALNWALNQQVGSSGAKFVLVALANRAREHEQWCCWPSQDTLSKETEQNVRTIRRHLQALEAARLIEREPRRRADGALTSPMVYLTPGGHRVRRTKQPQDEKNPGQVHAESAEPLGEPLPSDSYPQGLTLVDDQAPGEAMRSGASKWRDIKASMNGTKESA